MSSGSLRVVITDQTVDLAPERAFQIGRTGDCVIVVDDLRVSRRHLLLSPGPTGWLVQDCQSTGGTWIDGRPMGTMWITGLTELRLGDPDDGLLVRLEPLEPSPTVAEIAKGTSSRLPEVAPLDSPRMPAGVFATAYPTTGTIRIGRAPDNDIVVDDLLVSRYHAELRPGPEGHLELVDVGSTNGTFVNGRRVERAQLRDLDLAAIGHSLFRVNGQRLEAYDDDGDVTFEADGLTVTDASGRSLVDDVSFSLTERSLFAVVGPSGSGKSTLIGALAGLRPAQIGRVRYGGRDLYRDYAELRNRIGLVPQQDILHEELSARRALEFTGRLRFPPDVTDGEAGRRIDEVLDELGIGDRADAPISELSGGERRRTNVALELLTRPSLLFLDEPAAGLDPGLARQLMTMLRDLADGGRTIVVVTHELSSLRLCDQILMLAPRGVPAYVGAPQSAPAHFDQDDLTDVFSDLALDPDRDWRYRAAPSSPEAAVDETPAVGIETAAIAPPVPQRSWVSQVGTLSSRYLSVLAADRRNAFLLVLQAPILGLLMLAALPAGELGLPPPPEIRFVSTAGLVIFVVLLGATWLGANNAIREIARELPVLQRERAAGLSLSAYVASKVLVLGGLTALQAVVLVWVATARQEGPEDAVLLGWGRVELTVVVVLAGVAAMALALLVSALAGNAERATSILPIMLILQLLLSAGVILPEIVDRPLLRELSTVSSAQWGVAGAAATVDLNSLQLFDDRLRDLRTVDASDPVPAVEVITRETGPEQRWAHTTGAWLTAVGALLLLTAVPIAVTPMVLRRHDPGR